MDKIEPLDKLNLSNIGIAIHPDDPDGINEICDKINEVIKWINDH